MVTTPIATNQEPARPNRAVTSRMSADAATVDSELVLRDKLIADLYAQIEHLRAERECWMTAASTALHIATVVAERRFPASIAA
jgi:hypothetical protein